MKHYDVIIIGAGPAGIFCALELVSSKAGLKILLLEKGRDIEKRICPSEIKDVSCTACPDCSLLSGWGGAGAFSDGKLSLSKEVGGNLSRHIDDSTLDDLIEYTDKIYINYGAPPDVYGSDLEKVEALRSISEKTDLFSSHPA